MKPRRQARALEVVAAKDAVARALAVHGLTDEIRGNQLLAEWSDLVGPRVAARARPEGIRGRTLWVEVATSAWLQELTMLKTNLLDRLRERLGSPGLFDDIKFRLAGRGGREVPTPPRPRGRAMPSPPRPVMPATGAARERIVREVSQIDDDELRELVARVRITNDR